MRQSFADSTDGQGKACHQKMTSGTTEKAAGPVANPNANKKDIKHNGP